MKKRAALLALAVVTAITLSLRAGADIAFPSEDFFAAEPAPPTVPNSGPPMVALTFDDGPAGKNTLHILDVLEEYGAKATFFLSGYRIEESQYEVVRAIARSGCEIGNHGYSHTDLTTLSPRDISREIESTNDLIFDAAGLTANVLRPPYGEVNQAVLNAGYPIVTWCIDTGDWDHQDPWKSLREVQEGAFDGCIILMHDLFDSTARACDLIIPWLLDQGYELVTVSELFRAKDLALTPGSAHRCAGQ